MKMKAAQWCEMLGGTLEGNPDTVITHPAKIEEANEGAISFVSNPKYFDFAYTTNASALIVDSNALFEKKISPTLIRVKHPYLAFTKVLEKFNISHSELIGIEQPSSVDPTVIIGKEVYIGTFTYVGKNATIGNRVKLFPQTYVGENVSIADGTTLYSGAKVYRDCVIGKDCVLHSGVVIGSDGLGFAPLLDGSYIKIPQLGNVVIEDNVEIGANTTIDRATIGSTIIRRGVKLDNLIQVAHNVEIGEHTVIAAQTGISGSTKIGKHCMIGGQVGFVGHITIADGSKINAQSGVSKSIKEKNKSWNGAPAFEYIDSLRSQSVYRNLPEIEKRMEEIEKSLSKSAKK